jgi:hypothetical protein
MYGPLNRTGRDQLTVVPINKGTVAPADARTQNRSYGRRLMRLYPKDDLSARYVMRLGEPIQRAISWRVAMCAGRWPIHPT